MTGDPPRKWDDDSAEEDAEVHRARELARLERWMAEQKVRPIADALAEHGVLPGDDAESWSGSVIVPSWWDGVPEPGQCCPWCQRPGFPAPCDECRAGRATGADQPAEWVFWAHCTPAQRRLHIAARYGVDAWSGRRCSVAISWTDVGSGGEIRTTDLPYSGAAPDGIFWGTRRGA